MTDLTAHDDLHDRRPSWVVQSVFDPDGGGKDFAYTIGLDDLGHPELHLWGRPCVGDDPGEDWMFSPSDRCRVLNELAWQLLDGSITVGSEITRAYDDGAATVRFTIGPPGDIDQLEAYGMAPGAMVLPVPWSLTRPPAGPAKAVTGRHLEAARTLRRQLVASVDRRRIAPPGWNLGERPSWRRAQRWGPLTPVVLARAAQLWQADARGLSCLIGNAVDVRQAGSLTWPQTLASAAARRAGRSKALATLEDDVVRLVDHVVDGPGSQGRWSELVGLIFGGPILDDEEAQQAHHGVRSILLDVTTACLSAEAVGDVLDRSVMVHARGAWVGAFETTDDLPADMWSSPEVIDVVRRLLEPLTLDQLGALVTSHQAARDGDDDEDYAVLSMRLRGWAMIGPAGCPWRPTVGALPQWRSHHDDIARLLGISAAPHQDLREWCSMITGAVTHRARLSAADVRALARPFSGLLPDLERVLNEPVVAP